MQTQIGANVTNGIGGVSPVIGTQKRLSPECTSTSCSEPCLAGWPGDAFSESQSKTASTHPPPSRMANSLTRSTCLCMLGRGVSNRTSYAGTPPAAAAGAVCRHQAPGPGGRLRGGRPCPWRGRPLHPHLQCQGIYADHVGFVCDRDVQSEMQGGLFSGWGVLWN